VMHSVLHDDPPPLGPKVPPKLQQIISRALAKNPANRYQSAELLLEDLRSLARDHFAGGTAVAGKTTLLRAAKPQQKTGKLLEKVSGFFSRNRSAQQPKDESSSGSESVTPDPTPSMWVSTDKKTIAILPFKNLSGAPENDFYGFSLADSVITELAQLRDLVVRPSSYVAQFQNKDIDPRAVGTQLAVDAVLIGGYIKAGDRFRLTPQLIDTGSGEIVWSEKIDVESRDIITVQDTISQHIVQGLRVKTDSKEQERLVKSPTENPEAYECYLKGRTLLYKFITQTLNRPDLEAAVFLFRRAIELDPEFALAHSGLGVCEVNYVLKGMGGLEHYAKAKESFDRALEIDPKLLEPRVRMIFIDLIEGRSDEARHEILGLLRRAPNEPSVHSTAAYIYRLAGQYDLALEQWDRLLKISPTDIAYASYNKARLYIYQQDYAKASAKIAKGMAFEPNHPMLKAYRALITFYKGDADGAMREVQEVLEGHPDLHSQKITLSYCYAAKGDVEQALAVLDDQVIAAARADQDTAYRLATAYVMGGRNDQAIDWLEKSVAMGNENYPWVSTNPHWRPLDQDPRFLKIVEKLKERFNRLIESA